MRHDIIEYAEISPVIGRTVTVTVDRPLGSYHPEHKDMYYLINYGYVEGIMAPDGEEQDAYILGVDEAIEKFTGKIIARRSKYFCFDRDGNESIYYDTGICEDQHDDNSAWCCNQYHS